MYMYISSAETYDTRSEIDVARDDSSANHDDLRRDASFLPLNTTVYDDALQSMAKLMMQNVQQCFLAANQVAGLKKSTTHRKLRLYDRHPRVKKST